MALFELDDGRLIPAQFGHEVPDGFTEDILEAIRSQVLEIVSRPLFPITWNTISVPRGADQPRLTALDASGQVVAVEVVKQLDAEVLIDALSRLADTAALSWTVLAKEYPRGAEGFKREWISFRDAMPTSPPNGPRLILVAANISEDVRPALDVLSSSGVEVHEMSLRQMSNGRAFLEVDAVGPRLYGHRASPLVEAAEVLPELAARREEPAPASTPTVEPRDFEPEQTAEPVVEERVEESGPLTAPAAPGFGSDEEEVQPEPEPEPEPELVSAPERPRPPRPTLPGRMRTRAGSPPTRRRSRVSSPFPSRRALREQRTSRQEPRQIGRDAQGLQALAQMAGADTPLSLHPAGRTPERATLTVEGEIKVPSGTFSDPTAALEAEGIFGEDGWQAWTLGDQFGPTLAESLAEVNRATR